MSPGKVWYCNDVANSALQEMNRRSIWENLEVKEKLMLVLHGSWESPVEWNLPTACKDDARKANTFPRNRACDLEWQIVGTWLSSCFTCDALLYPPPPSTPLHIAAYETHIICNDLQRNMWSVEEQKRPWLWTVPNCVRSIFNDVHIWGTIADQIRAEV